MKPCCALHPKCEYHNCRKPAELSIHHPWGILGGNGRFMFICKPCFSVLDTAMNTTMKGVDSPENAPDDWRPSLFEHIRHATIAIAFEERDSRPAQISIEIPEWQIKMFGWTSAQIEQAKVHRKLMKKHGARAS